MTRDHVKLVLVLILELLQTHCAIISNLLCWKQALLSLLQVVVVFQKAWQQMEHAAVSSQGDKQTKEKEWSVIPLKRVDRSLTPAVRGEERQESQTKHQISDSHPSRLITLSRWNRRSLGVLTYLVLISEITRHELSLGRLESLSRLLSFAAWMSCWSIKQLLSQFEPDWTHQHLLLNWNDRSRFLKRKWWW